MAAKSSIAAAAMVATSSPPLKFSKSSRIRSRGQFREIARFGKQESGRYLAIQILTKNEGQSALGLTVPRRFGKAHERNRFKRQVREAFRLARHELSRHVWVNIRPLPEAKGASFASLQRELLHLLGP